MPDRERFTDPEGYYATLFHELRHSTGHAKRLARRGITGDIQFGSKKYAREELVAEITAAFLGAEAGIGPATIDQTAAYIDSWRRAITRDPSLVVVAAQQAQRAADHILGLAPRLGEEAR
jgi:antirestriction protein ArdC